MAHQLIVAAGYLASILGGIFFGLASCGGYAWHDQVFAGVLCILAALITITGKRKFWLRLVLALGTFPTYYLVQALSAPFYPSTPAASEYLHKVWQTLQYGPC